MTNSLPRIPAAAVAAVLLAVCCGPAAADTPLRDIIDARVTSAWQAEGVTPAPPADDAEFLRRIYLDLCGTIPTHDEAAAFLADTDPQKRAKLIDRLLDDPRFAGHQADVWDMVYFGRNPPGYDAGKRAGFQRWLREQFEKNTPYDHVVRAMLEARGTTGEDGAPMFLVQYRNQPEDAIEAITQRFLGVQLQCARCHDHPFEDWTQLDFYGMAAFLARLEVVSMPKVDNENSFAIGEKSTGDIKFTGPVTEDRPGKKGEPVAPKFLRGDVLEEPALPEDFKEVKFQGNKPPPEPQFSRKDALAEWVTGEQNPWFAKATANRVWAQFMGRGIVHPVDDMTAGNKPAVPELLDEMTAALVAHDYDLKWFIREIVSSRVYQLSSRGDLADATPRFFQRARVRPLSAEELAEAWRVATMYLDADDKAAEKIAKGERFHPLTSGYMLSFFGEPANGEGVFQGGLHEHLYLNNGQLDKLITHSKGGLLDTLASMDAPWEARVDRMFLSVLSRPPSDEERAAFVAHLSAEERPHDRLREAIWALMTSSEFRFNH